MRVTLASLDLFWLINQARILERRGLLEHIFSTRIRPETEGIAAELCTSCLPLHYGIRVMQKWPAWVGHNHFYLQLCRIFDYWLRPRFSRKTNIVAILSGVGLKSFRAARRAGVLTVVECGSTHADYQHDIVFAEYRRNGIRRPLFPKPYRDRVIAEFSEADYIQIPSKFVARTFVERGIPADKLLLANYGVDVSRFSPRLHQSGNEPFRVICPSGVNLRKGARVLMEAWRKLQWNNDELHWIGAPTSETAHLFDNLPRSVRLHPWMNHADLAKLYQSCDAFVLPSFEEGFARVMLEAAASGLPLIVTPNTGAEDFFSEIPEGWLIPTGDVDALCDTLKKARSDREATFQLGRRAAIRAQEFTWDTYGEKVIANYCRILGGQRDPLQSNR